MTSALFEAQQAFARGDHAGVISLLRPQLANAGAQALAMLGNSALALNEHAVAFDAFTRLHALQPRLEPVARALAGLHNLRGGVHRREGRETAARADFEQALRLAPGHREAGYNLALSLHALDRRDAALARLDAHLAQHPDDAEARWLAVEWRAQGAPADAAARLRDTPLPDDTARLASVAFALRQAGELDAARTLTERAFELTGRGERSPGLRYALAGRLALSPVMVSHAAIAAERERFAAEIRQLETEWTPEHLASCEPALEQLAWSNFYLAYHGEDDRELQRAYAALIERAAAALAPEFATPPTRGNGRHVGFLSSSFRDCTAGAYFGGWVDWLRAAGFEVHVYQLGPTRDAVTESYARRASHFRFHDGPLRDLARHVRSDALDLLVYPELGMDARLPALAALRLAPRQAMGWGHPITSGMSTIDAYFSCAGMEPAGAEARYTERLLALPDLGVDYARPPEPPPATRADLGLPEGAPLVLFPQSLFKIHPDNDAVLAELVRLAPQARVVMFRGEHPRWHQQFVARVGPDVAQCIHWLPPGPRERYLQVNRACDLMLDTLRWSGGNTTLDALCSGLPVLTCPGASMRARQSFAMLTTLGLQEDLVEPDPAALATRAAALLADPGRRNRLSRDIGNRLPALFDGAAARAAFVAHIETLCTPP